MEFTFSSKITKKGNIKVSNQVLEIVGADIGDDVVVTMKLPDENAENKRGSDENKCKDCIHVPEEFLEEADIPVDAVLEVYVDGGRIIIQEADTDE